MLIRVPHHWLATHITMNLRWCKQFTTLVVFMPSYMFISGLTRKHACGNCKLPFREWQCIHKLNIFIYNVDILRAYKLRLWEIFYCVNLILSYNWNSPSSPEHGDVLWAHFMWSLLFNRSTKFKASQSSLSQTKCNFPMFMPQIANVNTFFRIRTVINGFKDYVGKHIGKYPT